MFILDFKIYVYINTVRNYFVFVKLSDFVTISASH